MLFKYFFEIKNRFVLLSIGWLIYVYVAYLNKETILYVIVKANINNNFYFISTNVTDVFNSYLKIIYFVSFHMLLFFSLYHISVFIYPALYIFEQKKLKKLLALIFYCWFIGLLLFNLIILPLCWDFFLSFQVNSTKAVEVFFEAKITEYLKIYFTVYYTTILSLQFFVLLFLILNIISNKFLIIKKTRKLFYLKFFLIATLLTPPDVISQIGVAICFLIVYEFIIIINIIKLL